MRRRTESGGLVQPARTRTATVANYTSTNRPGQRPGGGSDVTDCRVAIGAAEHASGKSGVARHRGCLDRTPESTFRRRDPRVPRERADVLNPCPASHQLRHEGVPQSVERERHLGRVAHTPDEPDESRFGHPFVALSGAKEFRAGSANLRAEQTARSRPWAHARPLRRPAIGRS